MADEKKVGEVVEACTTDFVAQCYELYQSPALGSLVKARYEVNTALPEPGIYLYGVVDKVVTAGMEPGRRPIARGKNEASEEDIYRTNPQLTKLLKSEFNVLVIGYKKDGRVFQVLPPQPAHIHGFVHLCAEEEVKEFSRSLYFLNTLLKARLEIPVEELVISTLRQMSQVYGLEQHAFLVTAGKELASLLSEDYVQLKAILRGLKYDTAR